MESKQLKLKRLFRKEISFASDSAYQNFLKKGYRVISQLTVELKDVTWSDSRYRKDSKWPKVLKLFRKVKTVRKLDLSKFSVLCNQLWLAKSLYIAKRINYISCLKTSDDRQASGEYKELVSSWPKYMKNLKSFYCTARVRRSYGGMYYVRNSHQRIQELRKEIRLSENYLKYLPKLEIIEVNFPSDEPCSELDNLWKFQKYPVSIKRICFNGTKSREKLADISMAHLKNIRDLKFDFGYKYYNSKETLQSVMQLLPQVTQLEALHIDFIADFIIDARMLATLKSLTKLKKARFLISCDHQNENIKILESLEDCPLEEFDFRVTIREDESIISSISDFLSKKKSDLKSLKLRITKESEFTNLQPIEDLLQVVDSLPLLTGFSLLTEVNDGRRQEYSYSHEVLSEINLSFDTLFSRAIPLKKFRISLHQHSFSQNSFIKLLTSLKKFSPTLEKLRIDVGECKLKGTKVNEMVLDFIKSLQNIRSLKLYSLGITQKALLSEFSEEIQRLKHLRVFCLGEISAKVTKPFFIGHLERILAKPGLEKFECLPSEGLDKTLNNNHNPTIDFLEVRKKNPDIKNWPDYPLYLNESPSIHFEIV